MQKCEPRGGSASPRNAATQDKDDLPRLFYALYRKRGRRGGAVPKEIAPRPEGPNGEHGISARGERAAPRLGDLWPMVSSTDRSQRPTEVNIVFYIFSSLHRIRKIPTGHCDPAQTLTSWFPSDPYVRHVTIHAFAAHSVRPFGSGRQGVRAARRASLHSLRNGRRRRRECSNSAGTASRSYGSGIGVGGGCTA